MFWGSLTGASGQGKRDLVFVQELVGLGGLGFCGEGDREGEIKCEFE